MKPLRPFVMTLALLGGALPAPLALAQPKASQSVVHVRVFEGPN